MSGASLLLQLHKWPAKIHCSLASVLDALIKHQLEIIILADNPLMICNM